MLSLANTRDASGDYIFAGAQVNTAAFMKGASGNIVWQGSGEPPKVAVSADVTVSTGADGLSMLSIESADGRQSIFQSLTEFKALLDNPPQTQAEQAVDRKSTRLNSSH